MKTMAKVIGLGSLAVVLTAALATDALARGGRFGGKGGPGGPGGERARAFLTQALGLSEAQVQQLDALRRAHFEATAPLREQLVQKRTELHALWTAAQPDRGAILAKQVEMDAIRNQLRESRVDQRLAMIELLTPEQREKLAQLPRPGRMGERAGKGKGFGKGHGGHRGGCGGDCMGGDPGVGFGGPDPEFDE